MSRIRVRVGCERDVEWWLRLRRRWRIGRVGLRRRGRIVGVMDHGAVWRALQRRRRRLAVHGVAIGAGSSRRRSSVLDSARILLCMKRRRWCWCHGERQETSKSAHGERSHRRREDLKMRARRNARRRESAANSWADLPSHPCRSPAKRFHVL